MYEHFIYYVPLEPVDLQAFAFRCKLVQNVHFRNDQFQGAAPFTVLERLEQCSGIICNGVHTLFWNSV